MTITQAEIDELFAPKVQPQVLCPGCHEAQPLDAQWGVCSSCLAERINGAGELETDDPDDELFGHFDRRRRGKTEPRTYRVTCRVCERPAEVLVDRPRVCLLCAEDLQKTIDHIRHRYNAAYWRHSECWTKLNAAVAHADEAPQARWYRYCEAGESQAVRDTRAKVRAGTVAGPFADLVRLHLEVLDALAQFAEVERWADTAMEELHQLDATALDRYKTLHVPNTQDVF